MGRSGGFRADSSSCHQSLAPQEQVAEGEEREEPCAVLDEVAVADSHEAELAFDHPEVRFDLCPSHCHEAVDARVERIQVAAFRALAHTDGRPGPKHGLASDALSHCTTTCCPTPPIATNRPPRSTSTALKPISRCRP